MNISLYAKKCNSLCSVTTLKNIVLETIIEMDTKSPENKRTLYVGYTYSSIRSNMSNKRSQQSGQPSQPVRIQVQCISCGATQWIREPEQFNRATSVRWDCQRCHFNNQTSPGKKP